MKIIRHGQKPEEKTYEVTCAHCRTVFEFTQGEAKYRSDQRDGDYLEIPCPVCSKTVTKSV